MQMIQTVLFDLDGTLADTAADLGYALNTLRAEEGEPPLDHDLIWPEVSHGSPALLKLSFDVTPADARYAGLRERLLKIYADNLCRETRLFPGIAELLAALAARGIAWGVVTNKPAFLTEPLIAKLDLPAAPVCVVSGDSTTNKKPHPEPMLLASRLAGSAPAHCAYVGDAERDIAAGRKAGMKTIVALFGYIRPDQDPSRWGADELAQTPAAILAWIDHAA